MIKGYKIRLYPNKTQEKQMWEHIHNCRFIWNWMLAKNEQAYREDKQHLSGYDMTKFLPDLKRQEGFEWLAKSSSASYQIVCKDLNDSYRNFFHKKAKSPNFKSKKKFKKSFPVQSTHIRFLNDNTVILPIMGYIKFKTDLVLPRNQEKIAMNPRVSYVNEKWFLSFGLQCENQTFDLTDNTMGIDLGIKNLAIVAYGNMDDIYTLVFSNINKSKRVKDLNNRIRHLQRSISRKYEQNKKGKKFIITNNIIKEKRKLRKAYYHLSNIRKNYIHQCTHQLVQLLPNTVIMEDLSISNMVKNKYLSKHILDQELDDFVRKMRYKCEWRGIKFIQADRFFPSSRTCHQCGCIKKDLTLNDRTYVCPECGYTEDRDINAALNLMSYKG